MSKRCVLDTSVLQKANALINAEPRPGCKFRRRVALLVSFQSKNIALFSGKLLEEYGDHVPEPRNDFVKAFLELLSGPSGRAQFSWEQKWRGKRDAARRCRFPVEDDHVLRTASPSCPSIIYTEEARMLSADGKVHREFQVHIWDVPLEAENGTLLASGPVEGREHRPRRRSTKAKSKGRVA